MAEIAAFKEDAEGYQKQGSFWSELPCQGEASHVLQVIRATGQMLFITTTEILNRIASMAESKPKCYLLY